jgi:hypothetical protein
VSKTQIVGAASQRLTEGPTNHILKLIVFGVRAMARRRAKPPSEGGSSTTHEVTA